MEMAAAYPLRPMRMCRWKRGFHKFAVERLTARRKVPTAPMTLFERSLDKGKYQGIGCFCVLIKVSLLKTVLSLGFDGGVRVCDILPLRFFYS